MNIAKDSEQCAKVAEAVSNDLCCKVSLKSAPIPNFFCPATIHRFSRVYI